jgi:hypothetical protein
VVGQPDAVGGLVESVAGTSALVRALIHRWLDEQDEAGEANTRPIGSERERQPGLLGEEGEL